MHDAADVNLSASLGATIVDPRVELEWLDPGKFQGVGKNEEIESGDEEMEGVKEEQEVQGKVCVWDYEILDSDDEDTAMESLLNSSPPELESGCLSSDSEMSIAGELVGQFLAPIQQDIRLLPMNFHKRFETSSGDIAEMPLLNPPEDNRQSRFSWASSHGSELGAEPARESDVWWKPIRPTDIQPQEPTPAPPIPQKNPLRSLHRLSKAPPQGYSQDSRASRNIRSLQLDLSKCDLRESLKVIRSPKSVHRRSYARALEQGRRQAEHAAQLRLALSNHIAASMRKSGRSNEAAYAMRHLEYTGTIPRSVMSVESIRSIRRCQSSREACRASEYVARLAAERGHMRGSSDPTGYVSGRMNRWSATMPSHGCVRRSCIVGREAGETARLNINKRLPPLPGVLPSP